MKSENDIERIKMDMKKTTPDFSIVKKTNKAKKNNKMPING